MRPPNYSFVWVTQLSFCPEVPSLFLRVLKVITAKSAITLTWSFKILNSYWRVINSLQSFAGGEPSRSLLSQSWYRIEYGESNTSFHHKVKAIQAPAGSKTVILPQWACPSPQCRLSCFGGTLRGSSFGTDGRVVNSRMQLTGCAGSRTLPAGAIPERWAVCFPNSPYPIHLGAGFLAHPHIWKTAYFPSEKYFSFRNANSGWIVGQERNSSSAASGGAIAEPSHANSLFPELTNYPCGADRKLTHICITGVSAFVSPWNV